MSWLQTYTGRRIDLFVPQPEQIEIEDIAHALAHECRYAGHVKEFYSVAQHSVTVSRLCSPEDALWGLLPDASEACLGDVVKPLKVSGAFAEYRKLEVRMQAAICSRFGLPHQEPDSVKRIDKAMVAIEARDLLAPLLPELTGKIGSACSISQSMPRIRGRRGGRFSTASTSYGKAPHHRRKCRLVRHVGSCFRRGISREVTLEGHGSTNLGAKWHMTASMTARPPRRFS